MHSIIFIFSTKVTLEKCGKEQNVAVSGALTMP